MSTSSVLRDKVTVGFILFFVIMVVLGTLLRGDGQIIFNQLAGATSLMLAVVFCLRAHRLYGFKSGEGQVWLMFSLALVFLALGQIAVIAGLKGGMVLFRIVAIPLYILGFARKIGIAGFVLNARNSATTMVSVVGWSTAVFFISVKPALSNGFDYFEDAYMIFSILDIFLLFGMMFILQMDVTSNGWVLLSTGLVAVMLGDIFYIYANQNLGYYDGHPYDLIWYTGLLTIAYAAYYQRKSHLELIAM
ncbi:MAG: hypothetical protein N3F63_04265 [Thermoplasmata archaeon]|nr:hypothetical protein [Thermoplasmata archaeon]